MAKASYGGPAAKLALYEKLVATNPSVERKGASMPYTSVNGNMFSFLTKEGAVALRLSEADRAAFKKAHRAKQVIQHGRVMEEYLAVPAGLLGKTSTVKRWFDKSVAYAAGLKAKPTKRKAKASKKKAVKRKAAKKKAAKRATRKKAAKRRAAKKRAR